MPTHQRIHWLGAGLSTHPGIQRLAKNGHTMTVWNRSVNKAEAALAGIDCPNTSVAELNFEQLAAAVQANDIVISMLPGTFHVQVAELCLDRSAHFVSSSYISDEMRALDAAAKEKQLSFVNEVGLDPGIDHLFAHALVNEYRQSAAYQASNTVSFRSYCGGFPKIPNDFRYKFSWSPAGVLKALKSQAKCIRNHEAVTTDKPWTAVEDYQAQLDDNTQETFQAYPNRDSLPFMQDYNFDADWPVKEFVRGTLRLNGWTDAWADVFNTIDNLPEGDAGEQKLQALSDELWETQAYDENEPDRVVLCVELEAAQEGQTTWHRSYTMDATGNERGTAMARLVSLTVSIAVEAVLAGSLPTGVSAAPSDPDTAQAWLDTLNELGEQYTIVSHV